MKHAAPSLLVSFLAFAVSACTVTNISIPDEAGSPDGGGVIPPAHPDPGSGDSGVTDGNANTTPDGTVPPTDGDAGASFDAATSTDAGLADAIDPVAVGRKWTYDVQTFGTTPPCESGSRSGTVLSTSLVGGRQAFDIQSFCSAVGTSSYSVAGDHVEVYYLSSWILALDTPVQEGHTWSNGASTFTWHDVGSVTVPAGTFTRCFKAQQNDAPTYSTYCRGVGPVRWYYTDGSGNGYDAVLTSKNF